MHTLSLGVTFSVRESKLLGQRLNTPAPGLEQGCCLVSDRWIAPVVIAVK